MNSNSQKPSYLVFLLGLLLALSTRFVNHYGVVLPAVTAVREGREADWAGLEEPRPRHMSMLLGKCNQPQQKEDTEKRGQRERNLKGKIQIYFPQIRSPGNAHPVPRLFPFFPVPKYDHVEWPTDRLR